MWLAGAMKSKGTMRNSNRLAAALCCAPLITGLAHAVQTVDFANVTRNGAAVASPVFVGAGDSVKFDAMLDANGASNPPGTAGLGLCLEYKRAALNDPTLGNVFTSGRVANGQPSPLSECTAGSSPAVAGADYMVVQAWAVFNGGWPNIALPVKLYDAQYTLPAALAGSTRIGFGANSVASGQTFSSGGPLLLCGKPTVSVSKSSDGSESGSAPVVISVSLSAAVPAECGTGGVFPVALTLGGTATPGTDYAISGSGISASGAAVTASFPADGLTTALSFVATPVADNTVEGTETVTLTVGAGSGNYAGVGGAATASITEATNSAVVVEYLDTQDFPNSPGGHFFYSSDPAEQAAVDAGSAGNFHRTGREFLTGGTSPVCRFYGSISPGPNSHFFTVDPNECNALKSQQVTPTPTTVQQWNYERIEYSTTPPNIGQGGVKSCPAGTQPLYRVYNNAFPPSGPKNPWDSNHRFTPVQADVANLVALGWRDEGITFCTPQ